MADNVHIDKVADSYRLFHGKYKRRHGLFEYLALKLWIRLRR